MLEQAKESRFAQMSELEEQLKVCAGLWQTYSFTNTCVAVLIFNFIYRYSKLKPSTRLLMRAIVTMNHGRMLIAKKMWSKMVMSNKTIRKSMRTVTKSNCTTTKLINCTALRVRKRSRQSNRKLL